MPTDSIVSKVWSFCTAMGNEREVIPDKAKKKPAKEKVARRKN